MEVLNVDEARNSDDALRGSVGRLIEVVGTPKFESEVFGAARQAINCEHMSAVVASSAAGPRILMSAAHGPMSIPRPVAEKYARAYWDLDPATDAIRFCEKTKSLVLRIEPEEDIKDVGYRHECYTLHKLVDRLSIMQRNGTNIYRMNFYSGGRYGRFADSDVRQMVNSADILMSLLVRHHAAGVDDGEERTAEMFRSRLRLVSPKMPQREAEVCTAIMLGMTSEAIAIELGISVNTVLTYRKRAYGRLNISCQNELMRLILC
jgi:DNA-binding CsgD family transcriptional regulator